MSGERYWCGHMLVLSKELKLSEAQFSDLYNGIESSSDFTGLLSR